jgi:hypothetical protein
MSHPSAQTHPANANAKDKADKKEPQTPEEQAAQVQQEKDDGVNAIGQVLAKIAAALLPAGSRVVLTFPVPDQSSAPVARPTLEEQAAQAALDAEGSDEKNGKGDKKPDKEKKDAADKKAEQEVLAAIQKLLQPDDEKKDKKKDDAESAKSPEEQKADAQREQLAKMEADARAKSARWEVWRGTGSGQHNGGGRTLAYALKVVDAVIVSQHGALVLVQQDGSPMPKDETQQEREAREAKEKEQQDAQAKADAKADKTDKKTAAA